MRSVFSVLVFLFFVWFPRSGFSQGFTLETNPGGVSVTILSYNGPGGNVTIPSTLDGLTVTAIASGAFEGQTNVESVFIPATVSNIKDGAFERCPGLTNLSSDPQSAFFSSEGGVLFNLEKTTLVAFPDGLGGPYTIPDSVGFIGNNAFYGAEKLGSLTVPGTVTNIGVYAFDACQATNLTLEDGISSIGSSAFAGCNNVGEFIVPGTITSFGAEAFCPNSGVTNVVFESGLGSIGAAAFENCPKLTTVTVPDSVTNIEDYAFSGSGVSEIEIPGSVETIGLAAFYLCPRLGNVTLLTGVSNIGIQAFCDCPALTNINLPSTITNVSEEAFLNSGLETVTISPGASGLGFESFYNCKNLGSIVIPGSVSTFGPTTFGQCAGLTNVVLLAGVTSVSNSAFYQSSALREVSLPDTVTDIGMYAFGGCTALSNIVFPSSLSTVESYAFAMAGISNADFPEGVQDIEELAFYGCPNLTAVTIPATMTTIGPMAFDSCSSLTNIWVSPLNSYYSDLDGILFNKRQTDLLEFPEGLGGSYTVPRSVNIIDYAAFADCPFLTNVVVPPGVANLGAAAFAGAGNLASVFFGGNAPASDPSAFSSDPAVTVYHLPGTTGWDAFATNTGVKIALWNPSIVTTNGDFGVQNGHFGFDVVGTSNIPVLIQACTNLFDASWVSFGAGSLSNGVLHFSDPAEDGAMRYYRIRSP